MRPLQHREHRETHDGAHRDAFAEGSSQRDSTASSGTDLDASAAGGRNSGTASPMEGRGSPGTEGLGRWDSTGSVYLPFDGTPTPCRALTQQGVCRGHTGGYTGGRSREGPWRRCGGGLGHVELSGEGAAEAQEGELLCGGGPAVRWSEHA